MEPRDVSDQGAPADRAPEQPAPVRPEHGQPEHGQPASGDEHVAAALRELAELAGRPLAEHAEAFGRVHSDLQHALAGIDNA